MTEPTTANRWSTRREFLGRSAAIGGLLLAAGCGGRRQATGGDEKSSPGITDSTVKLGGSYPLSGPASAYATIAKAAQAAFKKVNKTGGVKMADGKTRTIEFIVYDDGYEPNRGIENARRLIEQDKVFALFDTLGTPVNSAIVEYVNKQQVPHLFLSTGASKFGAHVDKWPWTIGWQPAYSLEAAVYAEYLKKHKPKAKVAVLYQNDDFGKDYLSGFKPTIKGTDVEIVATETYQATDPSVDSQVVNLARSKADVFFNVTTPKFAAQAISKKAETGWEALQMLTNVSASIESVFEPAGRQAAQGVVTATYIKDPSDPRWNDDSAMQRYLSDAKKYGDFNVMDPYGIFGFAVCDTMVKTLKHTKKPTRKSLMHAVRNMDYSNPLLLPGVRVDTMGSGDSFPIESEELDRFDGKTWQPFSELIRYEDKTPAAE